MHEHEWCHRCTWINASAFAWFWWWHDFGMQLVCPQSIRQQVGSEVVEIEIEWKWFWHLKWFHYSQASHKTKLVSTEGAAKIRKLGKLFANPTLESFWPVVTTHLDDNHQDRMPEFFRGTYAHAWQKTNERQIIDGSWLMMKNIMLIWFRIQSEQI